MRKVKPVHEAYMGTHSAKCYTNPKWNTVRNLLHQTGEEGTHFQRMNQRQNQSEVRAYWQKLEGTSKFSLFVFLCCN